MNGFRMNLSAENYKENEARKRREEEEKRREKETAADAIAELLDVSFDD